MVFASDNIHVDVDVDTMMSSLVPRTNRNIGSSMPRGGSPTHEVGYYSCAKY